MRDTKIKTKLFGRILMVLLVLTILSAAGLFCYLTIRDNLITEGLAKASIDTEKTSIQISQEVIITQEIVGGMSISLANDAVDKKSIVDAYQKDNKDRMNMVYFIDTKGNRTTSISDVTDTASELLMRSLEKLSVTNKVFLETYITSNSRKTVRFGSPVLHGSDVVGYALCERTLDTLISHTTGESGSINAFRFMFNEDGNILTSMDDFFFSAVTTSLSQIKQLSMTDSAFIDMQNNINEGKTGYFVLDKGQDMTIFSYAPIGNNTNWYVMEVIPEFYFSATALSILQNSLIIFASSFILILVLFLILAIRNAKIHKLTNTQVFTDSVTGGATESKLRLVVATLAKKEGKKKSKLILIAADISNFNVINEIYGFKEGNEILKMTNLAWENVVKEKGLPARGFDDKFFIFYQIKKNSNEIFTKIDEFLTELKKLCNENKKEYNIAYNFGAYQLDKKDKNSDDIFEKAKSVLEDSKFSNKDALLYSPEDVARKTESNRRIEEDMVSALRNNEFSVYLQPKFNLLKKIVSTDALVRWTTRGGDVIPAGEFIPVFMKNGFIVNVDIYMYEAVCRILRNWLDKGYSVFPISLNHSEALILRDDYISKLKNIAEKYNIPSSLIEIEIDESWIYSNVVAYEKITRELQHNGFVVSIDSFGSRYASLELFKDVSADILKLDKTLLYEAEKNERGKLVFSTIVKLATALNIKVIAQGVETQKQANLVASMGCDITEGYLHGKPMPLSAFEQYYKKKI